MPDDVEIAAAHAASEESHNEEGVAGVVALDPTATSAEAPAISAPPSDDPPKPETRTVAIIASQFALNPEPVLAKDGSEHAQLGFGNLVFGGELWFDRSQLIELGSQMLQVAGKMTPPKHGPMPAQPLPPKLVGANGEPLVP